LVSFGRFRLKISAKRRYLDDDLKNLLRIIMRQNVEIICKDQGKEIREHGRARVWRFMDSQVPKSGPGAPAKR
jgi:hypothetical protein